MHVDLSTVDVNICKKICPDCIFRSIVTEAESKEQTIAEEIDKIESDMWKLFGSLVDADCLNSAKPDQFLAMKNRLNIKLSSSSADSDKEFT